jgi:hypothetical protein
MGLGEEHVTRVAVEKLYTELLLGKGNKEAIWKSTA